MHLFERHFKEVNISQRERSLFQAEGITRPIGRKNMRVCTSKKQQNAIRLDGTMRACHTRIMIKLERQAGGQTENS